MYLHTHTCTCIQVGAHTHAHSRLALIFDALCPTNYSHYLPKKNIKISVYIIIMTCVHACMYNRALD